MWKTGGVFDNGVVGSGVLPLASPATEPKRHWLSLPLGYPAGGVAVLVARLPFTLALFFPPSPRPPSQREGGDSKFSYARGFAPCIPGAEPARHLQNLPLCFPVRGFAPCGTGMGGVPVPGGGQGGLPLAALAIPAPGERTISNAEVPLPRSPLSLAAGAARREPPPAVFAANRGYSPRGCKGRSPLHKITLSPPLPRRGRGSGGWGQESKLKARSAGD